MDPREIIAICRQNNVMVNVLYGDIEFLPLQHAKGVPDEVREAATKCKTELIARVYFERRARALIHESNRDFREWVDWGQHDCDGPVWRRYAQAIDEAYMDEDLVRLEYLLNTRIRHAMTVLGLRPRRRRR